MPTEFWIALFVLCVGCVFQGVFLPGLFALNRLTQDGKFYTIIASCFAGIMVVSSIAWIIAHVR